MPPDDAPEEDPVPDGRSLRWRKHNEARRQTIIEAAITVLERQAPGEEVQIQAISDESGVARTVMYRHFADKADLDRAIQREICERLGAVLLPALAHDGSPFAIIQRIVEEFVRWSVDHPAQFWFAERDFSGWDTNPLAEAFERVAEAIEALMDTVVALVDVRLSQDDRDGLDPWVFGLIGATFTAVRRWSSREPRVPAVDVFIGILAESVWLQINGMALARGIELPDARVVDLLHAMGGQAEVRVEA